MGGDGTNLKSHTEGSGVEQMGFNVLFIIVMYTIKKVRSNFKTLEYCTKI